MSIFKAVPDVTNIHSTRTEVKITFLTSTLGLLVNQLRMGMTVRVSGIPKKCKP